MAQGNKKVLMVGGGGREHALGWKLGQSPRVAEVLYANGNAGTALEENARNIDVEGIEKPEHFPGLLDIIKAENIDMVVVGPEAPLANGLVDFLAAAGYTNVVGPTQVQAQIESDKFYSFDIMEELGIRQAEGVKCYSVAEAIHEIHIRERDIVMKARGLKAGKGVSLHKTAVNARANLAASPSLYGTEILISQRLFGQEFSAFALCDGTTAYMLNIATQDHKPLDDGDKGPNTGGMGAYCPAPIATADDLGETHDIMNKIVDKTGFKGFLYAGMMKTDDGLYVIEFNCRMGDPETQPIMMQMKGDLYTALEQVIQGEADEIDLGFKPGAACSVVIASKGYPGAYPKGKLIEGIDKANEIEGVKVFQAGTKIDRQRNLVTNGGRVLGVTCYHEEGLATAQKLAYEAVDKIYIDGGSQHRTDIGDKALRDVA